MRLVAIGIVCLALVWLGIRLLRLSAQNRQPPERWLGLAFLVAGASVWLLPLAVHPGVPAAWGRPLALAGQAGVSLAMAFLVVFTRAVFRPDEPWARVLCVGLIAWSAVMWGVMAALGRPAPEGAIGLVTIASRSAALGWPFVESAAFALRMRRRVRLGLGDPVVANRFSLWAIWTGAFALIPLFVLTLRVLGLFEPPVAGEPPTAGLRAVFVFLGVASSVAAFTVWLAFFPPGGYQRWIRRRAGGTA